MFADNRVWQKINQLNIERYTDEKSPETEEKNRGHHGLL